LRRKNPPRDEDGLHCRFLKMRTFGLDSIPGDLHDVFSDFSAKKVDWSNPHSDRPPQK
jgi:hypothetical protein